MFDFGFSELILIGVVMLVEVGPERLPKVARTAGLLLGRVQRYVSDVKSDIQREMQLEELKALQQQVKQQAQELESAVRSNAANLESEMHRTADEVRSALPDATTSDVAAPDAAAPTPAPTPAVSAVPASQLLARSAVSSALPEQAAAVEVKPGLDAVSRQLPGAVDVADKSAT